MKLKFSYLEATCHASLFLGWELNGVDEEGDVVRLYVRHIANKKDSNGKSAPDITYFEAENVLCELKDDVMSLLDEKILYHRKDWEYNPDQPRNLAKTVTVK